MYFSTTGIFLRTTKYKDNILIANIFTREYGLVSLMVRKTAKKPLLTQPLTIVDLVYEMKKNNTIGFIKECSINYVYKDILFNNRKLNIILILSELMRKLLNEENVEMFDFITESLKWLDNNKNTFDNFINYFLIKFCNISGIAPEYYGKNKNLEKAEHLNIKDGVFRRHSFDENDDNKVKWEYGNEIFKLSKLEYHELSNFKSVGKSEVFEILIKYISAHLYDLKNLKSIEIVKELN